MSQVVVSREGVVDSVVYIHFYQHHGDEKQSQLCARMKRAGDCDNLQTNDWNLANKFLRYQWRIQDFPDWGVGRQPLGLGWKPIIWQTFYQKLHKNERHWTERRRASLPSSNDYPPIRNQNLGSWENTGCITNILKLLPFTKILGPFFAMKRKKVTVYSESWALIWAFSFSFWREKWLVSASQKVMAPGIFGQFPEKK